MEEKGSDINKYQSSIRSNNNIYLFDDIYPKIKSYKKDFRTKSAINHNKFSFKSIKNNLNSGHSEIFQKKNDNFSQNVEVLSLKSRNKLNIKINSVNLSNILKTNDYSKLKLDTTKTTSLRSKLISSKRTSNRNYSKFNESAKSENKGSFQLKNNNQFSVINLKVDDFHQKNQSFKVKTLMDLTLQHFTNKLILEKISKNNNNKSCSEKVEAKLPVFNSTFYSYKTVKKNILNNKEDNINSSSNTQRNYSIKYSFLENTMNNILHEVNFVNIEKGEELYLKVLKKVDRNKNKMKFEDYKTFGHELTPEELYKMYQDKNQKEIKEKYEKIKQDCLQENIQKTKEYKLLRHKRNKDYIPEYKLELKNEDWKNKNIESVYKYEPIKRPTNMKKSKLNSKKRYINKNFDLKKLKKNNSENLSLEITKYMDKINNESNNKNKSYYYKINVRGNEDIKQVLFNNGKNNEINYINNLLNENENYKSNYKKNKDIRNKEKVIEKNIIININKNKNTIENKNDKIIENNINYNENNLNGHINDINHVDDINNNNNLKILQISKTDSLFIQQCEDYEFQKCLTENSNENDSDNKNKKRNSFNNLTENENIQKTKNEIDKIISNKIYDKKSKEKINILNKPIKSINNSTTKELNFNNKIFKKKEEHKSNNNKSKKDNTEEKILSKNEKIISKNEKIISKNEKIISKNEKIIPQNEKIISKNEKMNKKEKIYSFNKDENRNKISSFEEYIIYKEKILNEQLKQKKFFENIENHIEKNQKISKRKFSQRLKISNQGFNKIELNFISSKPNKYFKYKLIHRNRKYSSPIIDNQPKKDLINTNKKDEKKSSKNNVISDEKVDELAEKAKKIIKRRIKRSATLDFINRKINEIEDKKETVNIDEELEKNFNKYKLFKDVNLESIEDIEFNKTLLLFKIREKIRYKILIGECDKSEMDELNKFENKLNEYKSNYNLKNKKGIKQYALILLMKFNEFIELFEMRDSQKIEENRINKFIDDLKYNIYFSYPFVLNIKGKRCSTRNLNKSTSYLSEIKK